MAYISDNDCIFIKGNPIKPAVGHLLPLLQSAIEDETTDFQKTEKLSFLSNEGDDATEGSFSNDETFEESDEGTLSNGLHSHMIANYVRT